MISVDASDIAIEKLNELTVWNENALFVCDDFVKCQSLYQMRYDCIYSRLTLHAINEQQENELLENVYKALGSGGLFCIEARSIHDELFGKGTRVMKNAYCYNDHFRRFIDPEEFRKKLIAKGFSIQYLEENRGFSKTSISDPVLIRCIASIK